MSLEQALAENTAAVKAHTEALNAFMKKGAAASSTAGAGTAGKATGTTSTKPAGSTKPKGPTIETIQTRFGDYMSVQDKAVRAERKTHVLNIAGKFGADRATNIDAEHWAEALELLTQYEAGEDPFAAEGDGDDEAGDSPI